MRLTRGFHPHRWTAGRARRTYVFAWPRYHRMPRRTAYLAHPSNQFFATVCLLTVCKNRILLIRFESHAAWASPRLRHPHTDDDRTRAVSSTPASGRGFRDVCGKTRRCRIPPRGGMRCCTRPPRAARRCHGATQVGRALPAWQCSSPWMRGDMREGGGGCSLCTAALPLLPTPHVSPPHAPTQRSTRFKSMLACGNARGPKRPALPSGAIYGSPGVLAPLGTPRPGPAALRDATCRKRSSTHPGHPLPRSGVCPGSHYPPPPSSPNRSPHATCRPRRGEPAAQAPQEPAPHVAAFQAGRAAGRRRSQRHARRRARCAAEQAARRSARGTPSVQHQSHAVHDQGGGGHLLRGPLRQASLRRGVQARHGRGPPGTSPHRDSPTQRREGGRDESASYMTVELRACARAVDSSRGTFREA